MKKYKNIIFFIVLFSDIFWGCNSAKNVVESTSKKEPESTETLTLNPKESLSENQTKHDQISKQNISDYNPERTKKFDLIHTKLEVRFDWEKQQLHGTAELTMKPWFYDQSEVILDAKFFDIHQVELVKKTGETLPLKYSYEDHLKLNIKLDKNYSSTEKLALKISYTAHPEKGDSAGGTAITDDKGLYFINPLGKDKLKPRQIWTQGQTESSSRWFPTFDAPNVKTTQEISITVDNQYVTLSNGALISSKKNADSTRTDTWKQDKPHAPYLFMLAVGDFAIVKDIWKDKEVNYYVEPDYAPHVKAVFGNTPEMIDFFSELLDYPFPWAKYSQIVVRDFVSGAMENTSASVFMEELNSDSRSMLDDNWEQIIAHELFHQWFGDLVTCESWANLPLNESFANYAEYLWLEHQYGRPTADAMLSEEIVQYLDEAQTKQEPLIRYYYADKEEMFDRHSYSKGAVILHHFRNVIGDKAFFEGMRKYIKKYAYKDAEIHDLRLVFEEVTGEDLNWFFNQWFMQSGHPNLKITDEFKDGKIMLKVKQRQDPKTTPIYRLPVQVEIWINGQKQIHKILIDKQIQEFYFPSETAPDVVIFDAQTNLPAVVEHLKTPQAFMAQVRFSDKLLVRSPAVELLLQMKDDPQVHQLFMELLDDKMHQLRRTACLAFENYSADYQDNIAQKLQQIALRDANANVRAAAVNTLGSFGDIYTNFFEQTMKDSSYSVLITSIYAHHNSGGGAKTLDQIKPYESLNNIGVVITLGELFMNYKTPNKETWFIEKMQKSNGADLPYILNYFGQYLMTSTDTEARQKSANYLADLALVAGNYKVRIGCYQALALISDVSEMDIKGKMREIREKETDKRALEAYQLFGE